METRKLYYEDCHLRQFSARVASCEETEKGWNIEFLSRKFRVAVTAPFIEEIQRMGIRYNVIKK